MINALLDWFKPKPVDNGPPDVMLGVPRSSKWDKVRDAFIKQQGKCFVCGTRDALEAHHVVPFHIDKDHELDVNNLMALCRPHHLLFGHLMDWQKFNPRVRVDAGQWQRKIKER